MSNSERKWLFNIGDLVQFKHTFLKTYQVKTGVVVEQSLRMTKDNVFKIIASNGKQYWIPAPQITLLSRAGKENK